MEPGTERTITELATASRHPFTTVHAEVDRLVQAGILSDQKVGRARLISGNDSYPRFTPLAEIILRTYGPREIIAREFDQIPGVDHVYIYGSWARRYNGEPGLTPNDIDVLIIGTPDRNDVYDAAARAESAIHLEVNPTVVTADEFETSATPLLAHIRDSGLVAA